MAAEVATLVTTALGFIALLSLSWLLLNVFKLFVWKPYEYRRTFVKQGVTCLPYNFLFGNVREIMAKIETALATPLPVGCHELFPRILPYIHHWRKDYGDLFVFWAGYRPILSLKNPELVKKVLYKYENFTKVALRPEFIDLVGRTSVATLDGEQWAQHRRLVSPSFFVEKLKLMTPVMVSCITGMLDMWQSQVDAHGKKEIDVHEQFKILTADIIAHTAFGSSYEEGKVVFNLQNEQQVLLGKLVSSIYIPGYRFIPTPTNVYWWRLSKTIRQTLKGIIECRGDDNEVNDLLGILMAVNKNRLKGSKKNIQMGIEDIIDECKTFFFAGKDTTTTLMTWTSMLLAINPEWQERVREEVLSVCCKQDPTYESLHKLKTVGMVLNEALRLYPPVAFLVRQAPEQIMLGNIVIPPKTMVLLPILEFHHDTKYWGNDALEFNPDRFADGIANACTTSATFLPFSIGPRNCLGQNFALLEARAILAMMLQRFRFSLSPGYKHLPKQVLSIQPEHGMQIVFERV